MNEKFSEAPELPKTREERIVQLLNKKRERLQGLTQDIKSIQGGEKGMTTLGILSPDSSYLNELGHSKRLFTELQDLCLEIETAEDPRSEVQRLVEIIIQKDDVWLKSEAENDYRMFIFTRYFSENESPEISFKEVYERLQQERFNSEFLDKFVSFVPVLEEQFSKFVMQIDHSNEGYKDGIKEHTENNIKTSDSYDERKTTLVSHIRRLKEMLENNEV